MKQFVIILALALFCSMGYAQRPGGGSPSRGSSSSRSSMSMPRSSVSSSRSSMSRPSSTTSSRGSYTPSRSSSYTPSRSSSRSSSYTPSRSSYSTNRTSTIGRSSSSYNSGRSGSGIVTRPMATRETPSDGTSTGQWNSRPQNMNGGPNTPNNGHNGGPMPNGPRPGHPMPPVPHGMHPYPPMFHPIHHCGIHMHYCWLDHWFYEDLYWRGYYHYAITSPFEETVIYVTANQPNSELIALATDSNYVYSLYRDNNEREVYFTITDVADKIIVKTPVNKRYKKLLIGDGGVWVFKNRDRDPLFFMYRDGQLYKYEQD